MYNLILVDDDENQLFLNTILFSEEEIFKNIETFQNPEAALNQIKNTKDISEYIIVVDINMPQMSGWDFLNYIEENCDLYTKHNLNLFVASYSSDKTDIKTANSHKLVTNFIDKDNLITEIISFAKDNDLRIPKSHF